jgi:hypothetical protein
VLGLWCFVGLPAVTVGAATGEATGTVGVETGANVVGAAVVDGAATGVVGTEGAAVTGAAVCALASTSTSREHKNRKETMVKPTVKV